MWLQVPCYYGESLRWHKLHSSWAKQPLHYLCLHFCLLPASPSPAPSHLYHPSRAKSPQPSLQCKHTTTSIFVTAAEGHTMASQTLSHHTESGNIFKSLLMLTASVDDQAINFVSVCVCVWAWVGCACACLCVGVCVCVCMSVSACKSASICVCLSACCCICLSTRYLD